jgi:hypothetical protein
MIYHGLSVVSISYGVLDSIEVGANEQCSPMSGRINRGSARSMMSTPVGRLSYHDIRVAPDSAVVIL